MSEEITIKNMPYTVVGGSAVPNPIQSILFTAEGIKALAEKLEEGDMVRYKSWKDVTEEGENIKYYSRWTIVKKEKKKNE